MANSSMGIYVGSDERLLLCIALCKNEFAGDVEKSNGNGQERQPHDDHQRNPGDCRKAADDCHGDTLCDPKLGESISHTEKVLLTCFLFPGQLEHDKYKRSQPQTSTKKPGKEGPASGGNYRRDNERNHGRYLVFYSPIRRQLEGWTCNYLTVAVPISLFGTSRTTATCDSLLSSSASSSGNQRPSPKPAGTRGAPHMKRLEFPKSVSIAA